MGSLSWALHRNSGKMTKVQNGSGPCLKLREMDEKNMHNLFLKNMAGLIEETRNPTQCLNPSSLRGGMATHAGLAMELGITRPLTGPTNRLSMSPQMEAILIWCQCRTRDYPNVKINNFTTCWADGLAFCALIHHFFPQAFDFDKLSKDNRKQNYELAFQTGERLAGIPDFISGDDMDEMISSGRLDPKVVFAYVQEVYRALKDN